MDAIDRQTLWTVIILLGLGSFGLRFVFTGLVGGRQMPDWLLRHLRYTAVAVLPGLVAPLVLWPSATQGQLDAPRMIAATAAVLVGALTRNVLAGIAAGAIGLYGTMFLLG